MSKTKHDPDRDEHGHFTRNQMRNGPSLRWTIALALAAAIIGVPIGIAFWLYHGA